MRIALIAPISTAVKRDSTGSIEQLVWLHTEELVRRGHEVTLFATGNSETSARLCPSYPRGYEEDGELTEWQFHETMHVAAAYRQAERFDIIHSHNYHFAMPFERLVGTPTVHTYHVLFPPDIVAPGGRHSGSYMVAVSEYQRRCMPQSDDVPVVHNGIDTAAFPFRAECGDFLLYLGRMMPWKGPVEAIEIARLTGMRLVLAGPGHDYYKEEIAPRVDGEQIMYAGPVAAAERNVLLSQAAALLYPIFQPEPFGLVMIEAMACGTPVAALQQGAVPEIVQQGITGFHATNVDELAKLVPSAIALDRQVVRDETVRRFDYSRMTDGYLEIYTRLSDK